jgi:hypothetical protein
MSGPKTHNDTYLGGIITVGFLRIKPSQTSEESHLTVKYEEISINSSKK